MVAADALAARWPELDRRRMAVRADPAAVPRLLADLRAAFPLARGQAIDQRGLKARLAPRLREDLRRHRRAQRAHPRRRRHRAPRQPPHPRRRPPPPPRPGLGDRRHPPPPRAHRARQGHSASPPSPRSSPSPSASRWPGSSPPSSTSAPSAGACPSSSSPANGRPSSPSPSPPPPSPPSGPPSASAAPPRSRSCKASAMNAKAPRRSCLGLLPDPRRRPGLRRPRPGGRGFAQVTAPADIAFPRDHGPHPGFRLEWWYVTANLTGPDGTPYGAQWTLFRQATAPAASAPAGRARRSGWPTPPPPPPPPTASPRPSPAAASARPASPSTPSAPGSTTGHDRAPTTRLARLRLQADGDGFAYDLTLSTDLPPVLQGDRGFSVKSERGQASYYYSQPFYAVTGTLTLDGARHPRHRPRLARPRMVLAAPRRGPARLGLVRPRTSTTAPAS